MSEEQLKALIEKVKADTSLQEKLTAAADANTVAAIAKEAGLSDSADGLNKSQVELSEAEREAVAGGSWIQVDTSSICQNDTPCGGTELGVTHEPLGCHART